MRTPALLLLLSCSLFLNAQWDSCGVTNAQSNPQIEAIDAFGHFNGRLLVHNFLAGMQYSDDFGTNWDTIAQGRFTGVPVYFFAVNQRIYTSTLVSSAIGGVQYYSDDNGHTWQEDTVGMPVSVINPSFKATVVKAALMGDYIFYQFNTPTQFYWRHKDSTVYHPDMFANANFMHSWHLDNDTMWSSMGVSVYFLSQAKGMYQSPANANLNNYFSGLIYKSGAYIYMPTTDANLDWVLCRSEDYGNSWDTIYLQNTLGMGSFSARRSVSSIYAQGHQVWIGPSSKGSGSQCEILYSNDAGNSWTVEAQNLPTDPFGTYAIRKFLPVGPYVFAHMSFKDVYRKAYSLGQTKVETAELQIYPNPAQGQFRAKSPTPIAKIEVFDLRGNRIKEFHRMERYPTHDLHSGVYRLMIQLEDGSTSQKQILVP